jgi:UDP:flavonoid glycosyltransferase YjiC (YdhE family)
MKIAVLAFGTRGDVQPYAVLARHLIDRGHDVTLSVTTNLRQMAELAGIKTISIPIDSLEFFDSDQGRAILASGRTTAFVKELARQEHARREAIDDALIAASAGADVVVATVLTLARATCIAEASHQRLLPIFTLPVEATGEYPSPYLMNGRRLPTRRARHLTHRLFALAYWRGIRPDIEALRTRLGLGPSAVTGRSRREEPTLHLISRQILPEPRDWPARRINVGAPSVPASLREAWGESSLPAELEQWLDDGAAPVYFGFGSMPVIDAASSLEMIRTVSSRLGVRALVGAGWSELSVGADEHIYVADRFDHETVLPRCIAAVHHGGAGTTHTVLRAGLPAVIAHVFADQSLWGSRLETIGLGSTMPFRRLSADRLETALRPLLDTAVKARAAKVAASMREEDPLSAVTEVIEG